MIKLNFVAAGAVLIALAGALPLVAQQGDTVTAQAIVTVVPKGDAPDLNQQSLKVRADGKESSVTQWEPLRGTGLEFVILIDESARSSIGLQLKDLEKFIQSLP